MNQLFKDKPEEKKKENSELLDKFNAIKNTTKEVTVVAIETTRVVHLHTGSACGCDDKVYIIERTVPFDSDLKEGDFVTTLFETDKIIGRV